MRGRVRRDERGSGLVELTWLGILLLVPLVWILLSVFAVQRGAFAVSGAARAAGRAYVLAPSDAIGLERARAAALQALTDQGIADAPLDVTVTCEPYPHACHSGTSVVTIRIGSSVQLPLLPVLLGSGSPRFALDATQVVPVGQYQEAADGAAP
jgi:Flp pilus assembly protein TadG